MNQNKLPDHALHALADFDNYLRQLRFSPNTIKTYVGALSTFLSYIGNQPLEEVDRTDVESFNLNYILKNNYSASYQNQVINALKCYFRNRQNKNFDLAELERPIKSKELPTVLSLEEIESILNVIENLKHLTIITLIYSSGLRVGELINIRIQDVDSKRNVIHIRGAKGKKDRFVPLSATALQIMRQYYKAYRPKEYLFNGGGKEKYSPSSIRQIFRRACARAKITKAVKLHSLRHSYATHLLESGINLRYIQELLGHNSPKTTQIYTHVSSEESRKVESPLEKINVNFLK